MLAPCVPSAVPLCVALTRVPLSHTISITRKFTQDRRLDAEQPVSRDRASPSPQITLGRPRQGPSPSLGARPQRQRGDPDHPELPGSGRDLQEALLLAWAAAEAGEVVDPSAGACVCAVVADGWCVRVHHWVFCRCCWTAGGGRAVQRRAQHCCALAASTVRAPRRRCCCSVLLLRAAAAARRRPRRSQLTRFSLRHSSLHRRSASRRGASRVGARLWGEAACGAPAAAASARPAGGGAVSGDRRSVGRRTAECCSGPAVSTTRSRSRL